MQGIKRSIEFKDTVYAYIINVADQKSCVALKAPLKLLALSPSLNRYAEKDKDPWWEWDLHVELLANLDPIGKGIWPSVLPDGTYVPLKLKAGQRMMLDRQCGEWSFTLQCSLNHNEPNCKCSGAVIILRDDQFHGAQTLQQGSILVS